LGGQQGFVTVCFTKAFPAGGAKPESLQVKLKEALGDKGGIRINEVRFVREDEVSPDSKLAAQLMMRSLGGDAAELKGWLDDPQKLLQLILAAEASRGESGASGASRDPKGTPSDAKFGESSTSVLTSTSVSSTAIANDLTEDQLQSILGMLKMVANKARESGKAPDPQSFQEGVSELLASAQVSIQTVLASLAALAPEGNAEQPTLLMLAERLAVQFALDKVESGDVRAGAVHQMFIRMSGELEGLREVLEAHEEKLRRAGIAVESYADTLGSELWRQVSDEHKKAAMLSAEAWCCPPKVVQQFVQDLSNRNDVQTANAILQNYASCISAEDAETRRSAAIGIAEIAELYGEGDGSLLIGALTNAGATRASERDVQIQALVSAAFVRLTQVAATLPNYPAVVCAFDLLNSADHQRPGLAQGVGPRLGIEERLPNFIGQVVTTGRIPAGLIELLQRVPRQAATVLASRFNECVFHDECEALIELTTSIGQNAISNLKDMLATGSSTEALEVVGLLSRLDVPALEKFLPSRLAEWNQSSHDRLVRRLAGGASPERGRILSSIFEMLDPLVQPLAVDEIGMSGDETQATWLESLANENVSSTPYLRLKIVEALNRLRAKDAIPLLRRIAETKRAWRWVHPKELRIVALQALENLDPDWVRGFLPRSGIVQVELTQKALDADLYSPSVRQRRYSRVRMKQPVKCETTSLGENARLEIRELNLCGGLATCERSLPAGTVVGLKIDLGGRSARVKAFVRRTRARLMEFEIVEIPLEDRTNLRRFIAKSGDVPETPVLNARKRRSPIDQTSKR
jgi:hypothetical protein